MAKRFIMLVGLPASGKSTYARELAKEGYRIFSSDDLRLELPSASNGEIFQELQRRIRLALSEGTDCVLDATNLIRKNRINTLMAVRKQASRCECHLFIVPEDVCIARNKAREDDHGVTDAVIRRMITQFDPPSEREGFDEITVHAYHGNFSMGYTREDLMNMDQENPHHTLTVGNHEAEAERYIDETCMFTEYYPFLKYAARFHDDGKFFTKAFVNSRGEETEIAHFYRHERVSAYLFLVRAFCTDELDKEYALTDWGKLYVAGLIGWHMRPMVWEEVPQVRDREAEFLGAEMLRDLGILHQADIQAK